MSAVLFPVWSARFALPLRPSPKRRHHTRAVVPQFGKPFVQEYPDRDGVMEEAAIANAARLYAPLEPWDGPVVLNLGFALPVPPSWEVWQREAALAGRIMPTGRPDKDNLEKAVADALKTSGLWFRDDAQVVDGRTRKFYAERAGIVVEVFFLLEPTREEWVAERTGQRQESLFGAGA